MEAQTADQGFHFPVGAGVYCFTVSFLVSLYYNTKLLWVLWYFLSSFQQLLLWGAFLPNLNRTGEVDRVKLRGEPQNPVACFLQPEGAPEQPGMTGQDRGRMDGQAYGHRGSSTAGFVEYQDNSTVSYFGYW